MRGDQAALDEPVRDSREDLVVLEAAGLRLVRVDNEVVRLGQLLLRRHERPLATGREERAAAAAQLRRQQLLGHLRGRQGPRFRQCLVPADCLVLGELRQVAVIGVGEDDLLHVSHA